MTTIPYPPGDLITRNGRKASLAFICYLILAALLPVTAFVENTEASCNVFPAATQAGNQPDAIFKGNDGKLDRPFASPDDRIHLKNAKIIAGVQVTVSIFVRPTAPPNATKPTVAAIADTTSSCTTVVSTIDQCFANPADVDKSCVDQANLSVDTGVVAFDFPRTDALAPPAGISGPATVLVTDGTFAACDLFTGAADCRALAANPSVLACIDDFFIETTSGNEVSHPIYPSFTALPDPNVFLDICDTVAGSPSAICRGSGSATIEIALDEAGTMLIPMSWAGVWPGFPAPGYPRRFVRGSTAIKAHPSKLAPVALPGSEYLKSLDTFGRTYATPPLYLQQKLPTRGNEITMVGTVDKERSVLRMARRMPVTHACVGGVNDDQACMEATATEDCPGGRCAELGTGYCDGGTTPCDLAALACAGGVDCKCVGGYLCHGGMDSGTFCDPTIAGACAGGGACACEPELSTGYYQCFNAATANGQPCLRNEDCIIENVPFVPQCKRARCNASARACRFDDDCPTVGGGKACGQSLYDIGHRRPGNRQPAKIPHTPGANVEGVCDAPGDPSDGNTCSTMPGSGCPNAAPCVLFRAELGFIMP